MSNLVPARATLWLSYALSALVVLFFVGDAAVSLFAPHLLTSAQEQVGFPAELSPLLGGLMLLCAATYAVPRTAALGAILITGFIGGAICTHLRVGEIGSPPQIIAAILAVCAWLGLWLRDPMVRAALGFGRPVAAVTA